MTERTDVDKDVSEAEYAEWARLGLEGLQHYRDRDTGHPAIEVIEIEEIVGVQATTHLPGEPDTDPM